MQSDPGLPALADHLAARRDAILAAWRAAIEADSTLTTGSALPRAQLNDHIPALLEGFETQLRDPQADVLHVGDAAAHGLHRWQQGFGLAEVSRELGHLNECVVAELDACAAAHTAADPGGLSQARRLWASIFSVAVDASTSQYFKLQQREAAGYVHELEAALGNLRHLERQRAALWQQAAHDLRGNLGVVANVAAGLGYPNLDGARRENFLRLLDRNMRGLYKLLDDITCLARLQGGQEPRRLEAVDVAALLTEMGENLQNLAAAQGLGLELHGEPVFVVQGDAVKLHRIVQNLVLNAIRYTVSGVVRVTWRAAGPHDPERWVLQVEDTGPGLAPHAASDVRGALETATDNARDLARAARAGEVLHAEAEDGGLSGPGEPDGNGGNGENGAGARTTQGEGIGLSIVKRLCDLLDATIQVESGPAGTCFRILLPVRYPAPADVVTAPVPPADRVTATLRR